MPGKCSHSSINNTHFILKDTKRRNEYVPIVKHSLTGKLLRFRIHLQGVFAECSNPHLYPVHGRYNILSFLYYSYFFFNCLHG